MSFSSGSKSVSSKNCASCLGGWWRG
ncbi:MAG: hypothetical protein E6I58_07080 [Chloroflexi bacterium]|nr:MAG: hypothetical protein E6J05_06150 [Chloroflexota bacterium]TME56756.1 MAG: hypothetical protein E6I58_07080 [Chloroflexota bacterium]